ncbi:uncharacterized protein F5891DRAFT_1193884 [Suillus fuscotomentosus]|uniref:Uncharacterized protein n=1 Tax=Suillus fuscotomentosus TaxID=1912939 RepID=A0AAD4DZX2_9AGAM|nr:uncharacterized protein F5891DRAFT_1193884 [Suillus fuscotomentosus]KAG1895713.1 hypothetical protein F5891DRAFT_1193884 [Suillus fuscotomentosus]
MIIEKRVLHRDLSPNNFVVHDGIGYFIGFDHASILAEGITSTYSHGTRTMPYISIRILLAMLDLAPLEVGASIPGQDADPNNVDNLNVDNIIDQAANALQDVKFDTNLIEHQPSDDLESLFYIFFKFIAKYGGPHGQLAPTWSWQTLPWASAYEALGNVDTHLALSTICFAKMGVLMQGRFLKWGTMVYNVNAPQNQVEMTHAGVLNLLDATTKRSLTGSTNPTQCSIGINKNVYSGRQQPTSQCQHSGASLRTAPSTAQSSGRFVFWQPTSTSSQNIRKAPRSNERTHEEETVNQAPEHDINDDDQDQDQTDGENEERDEVQDQEQTLKTGNTTDFGQHEDDLDGEYEGEAQEYLNRRDFDREPNAVDDFLD